MNKFLQIKENDGYFYAERLGVDSIAFVLFDGNEDRVGLIREFKPPINGFLTTAFGGSLDKNVPMIQIVEEEVREESGYTGAVIHPLGRIFVSTQMNQFCHLYIVDVTKAEFVGRDPQTEMESEATVEWVSLDDESDLEAWYNTTNCWKATTILIRAAIKGVCYA